ncbi:MAG: porin [Chitinophagaceae bacterium]|nr:MAG: porin [Chitinophagaceae bacterium]
MQHIHRRKIISLTICLFIMLSSYAQHGIELNLPDHDEKKYYFGIVLGYNTSHYNITHHPYFLDRDTVQTVNSKNSGRIHLGIMATYQLSKHLDFRFYPLNLIFSEKKFGYSLRYPNEQSTTYEKQNVESIVMSFPLQVRLKSDRIKNFRVYTLAGMKYDFDLASNSGARNSDNIVKVNKTDYGIEGGVGFQFFFPYFILSPEIKFSYGLTNVHSRDEKLIYSNVIDKMNSRMILFSLHFEGGGK